MKRLLAIFMVILIICVGCESINESDSSMVVVDSNTQATSPEAVAKLDDLKLIREYIETTDSNEMVYGENKRLIILDNYELNYFDFTGDGVDDLAIVTWDKENPYNQVLFLTIDSNGFYKLINTDFRSGPNCNFFAENKFIYKDDRENQSYDIAYYEDGEFVKSTVRYLDYGTRESINNRLMNNKTKTVSLFHKTEDSKILTVENTVIYIDELGQSHEVLKRFNKYSFNEEYHEFELIENFEENKFEDEVVSIEAKFLVVGTDERLHKFESVNFNRDLDGSIDYYIANRQNFSRESRIKYINDTNHYILSCEGAVLDGKKIPDKASSVLGLVKTFWLADGDFDYLRTLENYEYQVVCIDPDYTEKLELMAYDLSLLVGEDGSFTSRADNHVDVVFTTIDEVLERTDETVYPNVLLADVEQIKAFQGRDIWKMDIMIGVE